MSEDPGPSIPLRVPIPVVQDGRIEQGYVQSAPGVFLYYRKVGTGPQLVLLHGGPGGDHRQLLGLDRLARHATLLCYDQRGCGRSTRGLGPAQVAWPQHVADLDAVRAAFGLEQMRVLGYSWGGILLQLYAAEHPDRLQQLVFVATALPTAATMQAMQATIDARLSPATRSWMQRMQQTAMLDADLEWPNEVFVRKLWVDAFVHPRHRAVFDLEQLGAARSGKHTAASLESVVRDPGFRGRLARVQAPALAIHGAWDPMPLAGAQELVQALPRARLVAVDECGHMPWLEAPDRFFGPVQEFLAAGTC
jgi:proline-specific peptidase